MSLEHILLGLLRRPATGYDLGKEFSRGARHFWYAERSQIYPTLRRMQKRGWLQLTTEPSDRGPERKVYETTEDGLAELRSWLADGPHVGRDRLAYIAQVCFLGALEDLEGSVRVLEAMRRRWLETRAVLESIEQELLAEHGRPEELRDEVFHEHAALRLGLMQCHAKIEWSDNLVGRIERRLEIQRGEPEMGAAPDPQSPPNGSGRT